MLIMETTKLDDNALFTQYINVVNRAIGENRDRFPFQQLLAMGEKVLGDKKIGAAVYKSDPNRPHDYFTLSYENGKLKSEHGKDAPNISWKVKQEHLKNVVENPQRFIENPARLDLDWLKTRLGNS